MAERADSADGARTSTTSAPGGGASDARRGRGSDGRKPQVLPLAAFALGALAVLIALQSPYSSQLLAFATIYALAVAGWNIVSGYAGQVSFGHAAFFGLGAYGAAAWGALFQASPWIGIVVGAVLAAILAVLVGLVSWRLHVRGIYFALVLFAVSELLRIIVANIGTLGGTTGMYSPLTGQGLVHLSFRDPRWFALIAGVFLAVTLAGTKLLARSSLGRQMAAVRNDEVAAEASGVDAMRVKLIALSLSAVVTAVAGGLYAQVLLFIQPTTVFGIQTNLRIILIGFLGGVGALWGPVLGAAAVTTVEAVLLDVFTGLPGVDGIGFGLLLIVAVTFLPHGLAGIGAHRRAVSRRRAHELARARSAPATLQVAPAPVPAQHKPPLDDRPVILEASGLTKRFGGLTVVDDASIRLREGTIHGLMGPNGAGKTTMLNMIAGAVTPDGGDVRLLGKSTLGREPHTLAHLGVARTFQVPRSSGDMALRDAVVTAALASKRSEDPEASAEQALATVGLLPHAERLWNDLNGSERRRFDVARCLAQEPVVLLLDEPMAGLGREELEHMVALVRSLPETHPGMTVLFVEHNMRVMMSLAEEITVLARGSVLSRGTPEHIVEDEDVIHAYLGRSVQ